jgi:hypothetical protein
MLSDCRSFSIVSSRNDSSIVRRISRAWAGNLAGSKAFSFVVLSQHHTHQHRRRATYFTESDDEHLQRYIARALPRKEAGGRMGNKVYQQLVELVGAILRSCREIDYTISRVTDSRHLLPGPGVILSMRGENGTKRRDRFSIRQ